LLTPPPITSHSQASIALDIPVNVLAGTSWHDHTFQAAIAAVMINLLLFC
jgi:hypothetical protein